MSTSPLILMTSRELSYSEMGLLHKFWQNVVTITPHTVFRNLSQYTANDVILIDANDADARAFLRSNYAALTKVFWIHSPGQRLETAATFAGKIRAAKTLNLNASTKAEVEWSLDNSAEIKVKVVSRFRRALNFLVGCLARQQTR